jgi:hypothetical protein
MNDGTFAAMVRKELERARTLHPNKLGSLHEAHSVIEEEFDEFWDEVRKNPNHNRYTLNLLRELTHLAAMCQRTAEDLLNVQADGGATERVLDLGGLR